MFKVQLLRRYYVWLKSLSAAAAGRIFHVLFATPSIAPFKIVTVHKSDCKISVQCSWKRQGIMLCLRFFHLNIAKIGEYFREIRIFFFYFLIEEIFLRRHHKH